MPNGVAWLDEPLRRDRHAEKAPPAGARRARRLARGRQRRKVSRGLLDRRGAHRAARAARARRARAHARVGRLPRVFLRDSYGWAIETPKFIVSCRYADGMYKSSSRISFSRFICSAATGNSASTGWDRSWPGSSRSWLPYDDVSLSVGAVRLSSSAMGLPCMSM